MLQANRYASRRTLGAKPFTPAGLSSDSWAGAPRPEARSVQLGPGPDKPVANNLTSLPGCVIALAVERMSNPN